MGTSDSATQCGCAPHGLRRGLRQPQILINFTYNALPRFEPVASSQTISPCIKSYMVPRRSRANRASSTLAVLTCSATVSSGE